MKRLYYHNVFYKSLSYTQIHYYTDTHLESYFAYAELSVLCVMLQVESIVSKRYGKDAYRMFRHLSRENKFCPTDKV